MHDSSNCPICRGRPTGGSMSDEEFFAFLAACRDELAVKQAGFQWRIADASCWQYEMADGSLTIGETRFGMTPVGTFSPGYQSWLWAWANEDFPEAARAPTARRRSQRAATTAASPVDATQADSGPRGRRTGSRSAYSGDGHACDWASNA